MTKRKNGDLVRFTESENGEQETPDTDEIETTEETEKETEPELKEAVSIHDLAEKVMVAFRSAHSDYWSVSVYPDFVISNRQGRKYKFPFEEKNGEYIFGEAVEVEDDFKPVKEAVSTEIDETVEVEFTDTRTIESEVGSVDDMGWVWDVTVIKSGRTKSRQAMNGVTFVREYPASVLKEAVGLFNDVEVFAFSEKEHTDAGKKGVRDAVGFLESAKYVGDGIRARLTLYKDADWLRRRWLGLKESGKLTRAGLSMDSLGAGKFVREGDDIVQKVTKIGKVDSVEVVHSPASGGGVLRLVASETEENIVMKWQDLLKFLESNRADLYAKYKDADENEVDIQAVLTEAMTPVEVEAKPEKAEAKPAENNDAELRESLNAIRVETCRLQLGRLLESAKLPDASAKRIKKRFDGIVFQESMLAEAIKDEKDLIAELTPAVASTFGNVTVTKDERDQTFQMVEAMFWQGASDSTHPNFPEHLKGVRGFTSLRQAYKKVTGIADPTVDEMMRESAYAVAPWDKAENPRLVESWNQMRESVTTSQWGEVFGDNLRKRMMAEYNLPALQSWRTIVSDIGNPSDFRTNRRPMVGGYGTLSTVTENDSYQNLTSPTDQEETYSVSKKGGLEDLTWEAMKNDDLGMVRRIPIKLGRASAQTLYRGVFDLLEDNTALVSDSTALIHANHNNTTGGVLASGTLTTGKQKMLDQTAYGDSTDVLGIVPRHLVVPNELEETAWQLTQGWSRGQGEHDSTNRNANFHGSYGLTPLVVPYFSNATYYWLVADPSQIPTIEVGFLDGRQDPEIFVQDNPNVGTAFSADKITYKVRHVWGVSILDYRGFAGYVG